MFPLKTLVGAAALAVMFGPSHEGQSHLHWVTATQTVPAGAAARQTVQMPVSASLPMSASTEVAGETKRQSKGN